MSSTGGKSYNETAPLGAEVDTTEERQLEAVRAMRRDGSLEEAQGFGTFGERVSDGISEAADSVREAATGLYDDARDMTRERANAVTQRARSSVERVVDQRPVQLLLGVAAAGFLLGRFG